MNETRRLRLVDLPSIRRRRRVYHTSRTTIYTLNTARQFVSPRESCKKEPKKVIQPWSRVDVDVSR